MVRSITQSLNPSGESPITSPGGLAHPLILVASMKCVKRAPVVVAKTVGPYATTDPPTRCGTHATLPSRSMPTIMHMP